ncbi:MAG: family 20 glycosylhydrolase [Hominisplanchenecus sp.]
MRAKKAVFAGVLASVMLCQTISAPWLAGTGALHAQAAAANVVLNKTATASGVENDSAVWTADKAVDGDSSSADSRWSSARMRPTGTGTEQTPQWLKLDLKADTTEVESIKIKYYLKVWSTQYKIQTSATGEDGSWEDVYTQAQRADSNDTDVIDTIEASAMTKTTLKRYVRFYFEKLNANAAGVAVSVREIEIYGTQGGTIDTVTSAQEALNAVPALTVSETDTALQIPSVSDAYEIRVYGSEVDRVIGDDGTVSPLHIGERSMNVILQATSKSDPSDTAKKNMTVTVPDNTGRFPELFPQISDPNPMPDVLPTIQEWYGYNGDFTISEDTEIIYHDPANLGLAEVAAEMQADLKEICGFVPEVRAGASGDSNDILLESLTEDTYGTGEEGYLLVTDDAGIHISSAGKTGVLYGTVTVEQILYQDQAHQTVPKGVIRDYPLYAVRGIMMDVARIPTRIQFLEDYTRILKWYKLNEMQIHLNDNQWSNPPYSPDYNQWENVEASHRLYSDTFPSLAVQDSKFMTDRDNPGRYDYYYNVHTGMKEKHGTAGELYYTKEEFKDLQKQAEARGIQVVAELDTPGHSAAYTKYVYKNQEEVIKSLTEKGYLNRADYLDANGEVKAGASFYIHNPNNFELLALDDQSTDQTTRQNAVNAKIFMKALFDEYLGGDDPVFTGNAVSAGVDEYWDKNTGNNKDAFRRYMNYMYDLLGGSENGYGKQVRMWGAVMLMPGSTVINKDIVLDIWATYEDDPIARMNEGFRVINVPQPYLYTTPGRYHKDMIREEYIYYNWDPVIFNGNVRAEKGEPLLLGAKAALWGDENREGITEADLNERYLRLCAMVGEKTWGGTKADDTFVDYSQTFNSLREGPGTQIANQIDSKSNVVLDYDFENVSKDGKTVYDASGNGYNGSITGGEVVEKEGQTWLRFDGNTTVETPLTSLGYPYTMSFDVYLDGTEENTKESSLFSGYDGRLQVAGMDGKLSLNRDYFTQSFDYQVKNEEKHTITIVGTYQVTKLYVDGVFTKILYAAASDKDNGGAVGASTWADQDNNFRTTFVFPMNTIGKDFSGYLANIKAYNKALSTEELSAEESAGGEVDVARNRHAYADNGNSAFWGDEMRLYPAWKATDGDGHVTGATGVSTSNESRWNSSDRDTDFLMVDLGENRSISKVVIDWEASRYAADYEIQVSGDRKNWKTVKTVTGNTSALTTDTFDTENARYVKMQGVHRRAGSNEYCIYEMKVYGTVDKSQLKIACEEKAEILAQKAISWENANVLYDGYVAAKAVLGDVMAGQEEVDAAVLALEQAEEAAKKEEAAEKQEAIAEAISKAAAVLKEKDSYDAASWQAFEKAYEAVVNASADLTAEELQTLLAALENAQKGLVRKPSGPSNPEQPAKPAVALTAPKVTAVKSMETKVRVSWEKAEHAASYQLYRKTGSSVTKVGGPVTGTTAYDTNPVGGKKMSYYVVALSGGQKEYKDSAAGSTKDITLPKATAKVTATQQKGQKAVTVKWKKVKKASSYIIYRAENRKGSWKKIATVKKGTSYRDKKKLKKGKTYYYRVVTVSAKTYSPMKEAKKAVKIR